MFTKTEYWNTTTALNIQFHIYKWNCTISHHKCTVYPSKTIFLPIYFYLAVNLQGFFTSSSTAKQKVSNLLLSWFTFFVEIAHFSDWAVFIWAALSAIGTTQHTPEQKGLKTSWYALQYYIHHFMHCIFCDTWRSNISSAIILVMFHIVHPIKSSSLYVSWGELKFWSKASMSLI